MSKRKPTPREPQDDALTAPPGAHPYGEPSGRVQFDDRGNAVWEWAAPVGAFGADVDQRQLRGPDHAGPSIAGDAPTPSARIKANAGGALRGYDPYDSGRLGKAERQRKKDLRKLSEWISLKKKAAQEPDEG